MVRDDGWNLIETVTPGDRVIVFAPNADPQVFEAEAYPDGEYKDPVYNEWFSFDHNKATLWKPMPEPPKW